jgi:hypothetical protein
MPKTTQTSETRSRRSRIGRVANDARPSFRLTPRDASIVLAVYEHRVLTTVQIQRLFFGERDPEDQANTNNKNALNSRCQYRLQALYHHGYLLRDEQPQKLSEGRKPLVYFLDKQGAELVAGMKEIPMTALDWKRGEHKMSYSGLNHLLATNDVRISITLSARRNNAVISEWIDDRTLRSRQTRDVVTLKAANGATQKAAIVPDGYFTLETVGSGSADGEKGHYYHQFIEVDLGTMTGASSVWGRRDWSRKIRAYLEYYRSGKYQERYGTKSMRVLTVTTNERRLATLREATGAVGGKSRFWFTTFARLQNEDPLTDTIWHVSGSGDLRALVW